MCFQNWKCSHVVTEAVFLSFTARFWNFCSTAHTSLLLWYSISSCFVDNFLYIFYLFFLFFSFFFSHILNLLYYLSCSSFESARENKVMIYFFTCVVPNLLVPIPHYLQFTKNSENSFLMIHYYLYFNLSSSFLFHCCFFSFLATFILKRVSEFIFLFLISHHQKNGSKFCLTFGYSFWYISSISLPSVSLHPAEELLTSYQCLFNLLLVGQANRCVQPLSLEKDPVVAFRPVQLPSLFFVCRFFFLWFSPIVPTVIFQIKILIHILMEWDLSSLTHLV